ncbi:hypothetical protein BDY21DRAFT_421204 [Lineolata rhizophorae]|uniref:DUF7137 domain-containing protein n=1 Tax=Lineolata rhizophorae TaxID=578093 RepID=A0A6A6P1L6_9PEZI|nr:hypothetical protein BDY21DRAFT_421204 [Lineolata rhizophorae]
MRPANILATCFALVSVSAASWPSWEDNKAIQGIEEMLFRRQDDAEETRSSNEDDSESTAEPTVTRTRDSEDSESTSDAESTRARESDDSSATASETGDDDEDPEETGTVTGTKTSGTAAATSIDERLPAGGISMVTPAVISGPQYYKIGDYVTFGWNYTSLSVTPKHIDILASCKENDATYTLAVNQSAEETAVTWDTGEYQATATVPLLTETYTLIIYDADSSISAVPSAGYLGVFNQWTFGMYTPQPYVPRNEFTCASCNSALSIAERQTLGVVLTMGIVTVFSFTWFASGFLGLL